MAVWEKILYELKLKGKIDRASYDSFLPLELEAGIKKLVEIKAVADREQAFKYYFLALKSHSLEDVLISEGYLPPEDFETVINEFGAQKSSGKFSGTLKEYLIEKKILTPRQVFSAIAIQHRLDFIDLDEAKIDHRLPAKLNIDFNILRRYQFIPYEMDNAREKLVIIIDDPSDVDRIEEIESVIGIPTTPLVSIKSDINNMINVMASGDPNALLADGEGIVILKEVADEESEEKVDTFEFTKTISDNTIVSTVNRIIRTAVRLKASDIHFESYAEGLFVKYRIHGVLRLVKKIDVKSKNFVVSRLKNMANLDISEKRIPQDGRIKLYIDDRSIDFRVSVLPSIFGETVVIRILDQNALGLDLARLGFPDDDLVKFNRCINKSYGMILVAGPTGSGKTTTLYSAIKAIKKPEIKVVTVEDPVEYQIPDIVQVNVNEKKGLTFASGLRSILRQDPNKIMVGEIRDLETATIAINAALTGHLVFSTIHANNSVEAIGRLSNMGVDTYQFAASLKLILAQRLIRTICPNCREEVEPDAKILSNMRDFEKYISGKKFYRGKGCVYCRDEGYAGRTGIYETLEMDDEIQKMIIDRRSPIDIKNRAVEAGMRTLSASAWTKVTEGVSTLEELARVANE